MSSRYSADTLECEGLDHCFDFDKSLDRYWAEDGWDKCENSPCPNRYLLNDPTRLDDTWGRPAGPTDYPVQVALPEPTDTPYDTRPSTPRVAAPAPVPGVHPLRVAPTAPSRVSSQPVSRTASAQAQPSPVLIQYFESLFQTARSRQASAPSTPVPAPAPLPAPTPNMTTPATLQELMDIVGNLGNAVVTLATAATTSQNNHAALAAKVQRIAGSVTIIATHVQNAADATTALTGAIGALPQAGGAVKTTVEKPSDFEGKNSESARLFRSAFWLWSEDSRRFVNDKDDKRRIVSALSFHQWR